MNNRHYSNTCVHTLAIPQVICLPEANHHMLYTNLRPRDTLTSIGRMIFGKIKLIS